MAELKARDAKLIQYLREAYVKERELEQALQAHISMTALTPYRKRLQQHLTETKNTLAASSAASSSSAEEETVSAPGPGVSRAASALAFARGAAMAQGPVHALRGTSDQEKMLKNAKTESRTRRRRSPTTRRSSSSRRVVGDRDTAALAKAIKREEERMRGFLERLIPQLTKAVAQAEIPASQRGAGRRRSTSARKTASSGTKKRTSTARRSGGARSTSARRTTKKRTTAARLDRAVAHRPGARAAPPGDSAPPTERLAQVVRPHPSIRRRSQGAAGALGAGPALPAVR